MRLHLPEPANKDSVCGPGRCSLKKALVASSSQISEPGKKPASLDFWFHQKMLQITSEVARGESNHCGRNVSSETRFTGTFRSSSTWRPGAPGGGGVGVTCPRCFSPGPAESTSLTLRGRGSLRFAGVFPRSSQAPGPHPQGYGPLCNTLGCLQVYWRKASRFRWQSKSSGKGSCLKALHWQRRRC